MWLDYQLTQYVANTADITIASNFLINTLYLYTAIANRTTGAEIFRNSISLGTRGAYPGGNNITEFPYSVSRTANLKLQEMIIYPSDQSSNRPKIEANISNYYSIYTNTNNGFVTTWYDQSGNGNDATQSTAANQPQIVSGGSVINVNSKPSLQFDGTNDSFNLSSNISSTTSYTAIEVNRRTDTTANSVGIASSIAQPYVNLFLSTTLYFSRIVSGSGYFGTYSIDSTNQQLLFSIDDKSSNLKTYLNQNLVIDALNPFGNSGSGDFNNIGIRSGNTKDIKQELIFYASDQSSNRTGIQTNINQRYNIYFDGSYTPLLDTYSGSAAAYSLRLLNSSYTGPLIEVRNDSGVHADIGFTYDGKLNEEALLLHCGSGNGTVSTWYDQSGNGNDATQGTAANQPQIVSSGSVIVDLGNKPCLKFSGDQWINNASTFTINQPFTNFTTSRLSSTSGFPYFWRSQLGNDTSLELMGILSGEFRIYAGSNFESGITATNNTNFLLYALYNSASSVIGVNNTNIVGSAGSNSLKNGISFGVYNTGSGKLNGFISESIFYGSDQSSNRTGIETNINDFYSIY